MKTIKPFILPVFIFAAILLTSFVSRTDKNEGFSLRHGKYEIIMSNGPNLYINVSDTENSFFGKNKWHNIYDNGNELHVNTDQIVSMRQLR